MVYDVSVILEELKGHEGAPDREIKIKLDDGTVREIDGFQFKNACIGGDDIIYIKEISPLKREWKKPIESFLEFGDKIMNVCELEYDKHCDDEDYDTMDILHIENEIAKLADFYITRCNLQEKVKEEWGYYEPGAGDTDEVFAKLRVLRNFVNF